MNKLGLIFAGLYLILSGYLILSQGLFGESFIALVLGLPWSFGLAFFEYFALEGPVLVLLLLLPLALNAYVLYWIGRKLTGHPVSTPPTQ